MNASTLVQKLWNLPPPEVIAAEIIDDLQAALDQLKELEASLAPAQSS